jgi:hypothetical protein
VHFTSASNKNSILAPIIGHMGSIERRYKNKHFGQLFTAHTINRTRQ